MSVNIDFFSANLGKLIESIKKASDKFSEMEDTAQKAGKSVSDSFDDASSGGKKLEEEFDKAKFSVKELNGELKRLREARDNSTSKKQISDINESIKLREKEKRSLIDLGKEEENFNQKRGKSAGLLKKFGPILLKAFSVTAILAAVKGLINFQQELEKTRKATAQLSGETGKQLNRSTSRISALAKTFNKDFDEVLLSVNAIAKAQGISFEDAADGLADGFLNGADATGELLETTKEYSGLLAGLGVSLEQNNEIIAKSSKDGVYSDKGIDAIKEAGLALREMTPAASDALRAIGLSGKEIQQQISDGTLTQFQAIQQVADRLGQFGAQSQEVGLVLADVFKGAGEDAGIGFIKTLKDVGSGYGELSKESENFRSKEEELYETTVRFEQIYNDVFDSADGLFTGITTDIKIFVSNGLIAAIEGVQDLTVLFKKLYNNSVNLRGNLQAVKLAFTTTFEVAKLAVFQVIDILKILGSALSLDFQGVKDGFSELIDDTLDTGKSIGKNLKAGFDEVVNGNFIIGEEAIGEEFVFKSEKTAKKSGKKLGKIIGKSAGEELKRELISQMRTIEEILNEDINKLKLQVDVVFPDAGIDEDSLNKSAQEISKKLNESIAKVSSSQPETESNGGFLQKLFGINDTSLEETKEVANAFVGEFGNFLGEMSQLRIEKAEEEINNIDSQIERQQEALNEQLEFQKNHKANSVETEVDSLNKLKDERKKALEDQKKAVRLQQAVDSIQQASSIATASANILKGFSALPLIGQVLGVAAVVSMIGSFIAQKARAKSAAGFFKGGYTGEGSIYDESVILGQKSYAYHNKEFVFENKKTKENRGFFEALHNDRLSSLSMTDPTLLKIASESPILNLARSSEFVNINSPDTATPMILSEVKELIKKEFERERITQTDNGYIISNGGHTTIVERSENGF